jgi:mycothiol system anti-sigma-R factor
MTSFSIDPCAKCEEAMQPYLDGTLSDAEIAEAKAHLALCAYCAKRYRFEVELRHFVRKAAVEEMPPELKHRLSQLRTPLL